MDLGLLLSSQNDNLVCILHIYSFNKNSDNINKIVKENLLLIKGWWVTRVNSSLQAGERIKTHGWVNNQLYLL